MHKQRLSVVALAISAIWASGCDSSTSEARHQRIDVGAIHNRGLDFMLANLKSASKSNNDRIEWSQIVEDCEYYMGQYGGGSPGTCVVGIGVAGIEYPLSTTYERPEDVMLNPAWGPEKDYIIEIFEAFSDSSNLGDAHGAIASIISEADANLTPEQADRVYYVASVAGGSLDYWQTNYDTWAQTIAPGGKTAALPPWGKALLRSDIGGAAAGLVVSLVTGCGELTVGVCMATAAGAGALGASTAKGVEMLLGGTP